MRILNTIWKIHPSEWLAGRRLTWLLCLLLAAGLLRVYLPVWRSHSAMVVADPYTYVGYARNLAKGRFTLDNALATLAAERAQPGRDDNGPGAMGPVWNTAIRPDGKTIYTVEIAYPFLLSLAVRTGGVPFAVYSNFLLWPLLFVLIFRLVRRGYGLGPAALAAAVAVCLLFPAFDHPTFRQMHYPWREPFFMCLLTGGLLLVLSYTQGGRARLLPFAALLFGLACSAKIANGVYLPVIAVFVLVSKAFRAEPGKPRLLVVCALAFLAGLAPFFIQNLLSTGHPLRSLQVLRETSEYSATEIGHGLSFGNIGMTTRRYLNDVYRDAFLLRWPVVALAVSSLWTLRRRPVVWLVAGLLAAHLALYLQWGNADHRHMVFASLLFCVLAGMAVVALVECWRWAVALPVALALGVPLAKVSQTKAVDVFGVGDARRLAQRLEVAVQKPAIIFSNRTMRDVIGVYSGLDVAAYHELLTLDDRDHGAPLVRRLMEKGWNTYFLDNEDQDPKHRSGRKGGVVDYTAADEVFLLENFDLVPRIHLPVREFNIGSFDSREQIRLFEVQPWRTTRHERRLPVQEGGAAFLFLNGRSAATNLSVTVNGTPVDVATHARRFYHPMPLSGTSAVVCVESPEAIPSLEDLRLVGWDERMVVDLGYDAPNLDQGYFDVNLGDLLRYDHRRFTNNFEVTLPVRSRDGCFTVLSMSVARTSILWNHGEAVAELDRPEVLPVYLRDGTKHFLQGLEGRYHYAVPNDGAAPASGYAVLGIPPTPGFFTKCERFISSTAWRERRVESKDAHGLAIVGKLFPDRDDRTMPPVAADKTLHPFAVKAGGTVLKQGKCHGDPYRPGNLFAAFAAPASAENGAWNVRVEGAAIMDILVAPIGSSLRFEWDGPLRGCAVRGFYPVEKDESGARRAWTEGSAAIKVPVSPGASAYSLRLALRNGTPEKRRVLRVMFQGKTEQIELGPDQGVVEQDLVFRPSVEPMTPDCADLVFECDPWSPARAGISADNRELGVQIYRLTWTPKERL